MTYAEIVAGLDPSGPPELVFTYRHPIDAPRRVGVLAASFNPPTNAHIRMAERAREKAHLDEVILELAKANVDKDVTGARLHERLLMLRRIAAPRRWCSVAASSHGRFLEKAAALRRHFPSAELFFIVGYDTLVRVFDPKYYERRDVELDALFRESRFICANRGEAGSAAIVSLMERPGNRRFADRILTLELDAYHASLSSTSIRAALAAGRTEPDGLPVEVAEYIRDRGLYGTRR